MGCELRVPRLQATSTSETFFPWKIFITHVSILILVIVKGQAMPLAWRERTCHSTYNTPESESAELVGKYLLSRWKLRADASIINRTLPTCSSCPGWSCVPLGLQVILFSLFRNESLLKCTTPKQEFGTFRRWYRSLLSPLKLDELGNWCYTRGWFT